MRSLFFANFIDDQSSITNQLIPMKIFNYSPAPPPPPSAFLQLVSNAVAQLKQKLQRDYEQAYPHLREIIHLILDQEESNAWKLSIFPHLVFPDLVESHVARLNLQPAATKHYDVFVPRQTDETPFFQPALALCG